MSLRILIAEDEAVVARRLERLLRNILVDRPATIQHAGTISQAIDWMESRPLDLLFLDLNLHGRDGFQILHNAVSRNFQTVIVSAHEDQAVRAFEFGVADFVPKPFSEDRLRKSLDRALQRDSSRRGVTRYLAVRRAGEVRPVPVSDIVCIRGAGDYSELHCRDGSAHLHDKSLTALEQLLPDNFLRVHRSHVVNLDCVVRLTLAPGSRYTLRMSTGDDLPVGRSHVAQLRAHLP